MKTPQLKTSLIAIGSLALTLVSQAANVNLTASEPAGFTAFTTKTNWSNGAAPSAGNNYFTSTFGFRTPPDNLSYTFAGDSLTLNPGTTSAYSMIEKGSAGAGAGRTLTINNFTNAGGLIRSGGTAGSIMTITGNVFAVTANSTLTADQCNWIINSPLIGTGILTNNFANAQTAGYGGNNSAFAGKFLINGIVLFNNQNAVPGNPVIAMPDQIILGSGGTLRDNIGITLNNANGGVTLYGNATVNTVNATSNTIVAEPIVGAFTLTKSGAGTLTLSGANTISGLTLTGGLLNINNQNAVGTGTLTFNSPTLVFDNITGSAFTLPNNNAQTWATNFSFTGSSSLNLGTGAVTLTGSPAVTVNANTLTVGGSINGAFSLAKAGPGTLSLTASNGYTGITTITNGVVIMGNPYSLGTNAWTFGGTTNATLDMATDGGDYTNVVNAGSSTIFTIAADVKTGSTGINHTMGTFLIGSGATPLQLNITKGPNVASGSPQITANAMTLSGGSGGTTILNPSSASLALGSVTAAATSKTLQLDGTNVNSSVTGAIADGGANIISIVKTNTGKWTLNGVSTYTGTTTIGQGTLALGSSGAINGSATITILPAGTLDVSASSWSLGAAQTLNGNGTVTGNFSDNTGSQITPGGAGTVGTLTFNNNLNLAAGDTNKFDFSSTTNDLYIVNGNLNPAAGSIINLASLPAGGLPNGTYTLMQVTGTLGGSASNFTITGKPSPSRQSFAIAYDTVSTPHRVLLQVTGSAAGLVWLGTSTTWDIVTTADWTNAAATSTDVYFDGDNVSFTDLGSAASPVLNATVQPGSVTVNSANAYTLSGTGAINGSAGLTKSGSGTLTVQTVNGYTGVTAVNGGVLSVATITNGGVASPIGAASSAAANLAFNGGDLQYTGGSASTDRGATLNAGGGTVEVTSAATALQLSSAIVGSSGGSLTKAGNGTLVLTGANAYNGGTAISGGTLQVGNGGATGVLGTGPITDNSALLVLRTGTITLSNAITGSGSITNNGTGTLVLAGTNTYLGSTTINTGLVQVVSSQALGGTPAAFDPAHININVGELEASTSFSLSDTNSGVTVTAGTIGVDAGVTLTISNQVVSATSLTKALPGTLVLSGSNTLTGILNVDTASPTASDGVVLINSTNALGGVPTIQIRNNQGPGSSTLQLNGTLGSINVNPATFIWSGRNNFVPAIENVAGDNIWNPGSLTMNVGGTLFMFQADAGSLTLPGTFPTTAPVAGRTFSFDGPGYFSITGSIQSGGCTNLSLFVTNNGTVTLWSGNSYSGITSVQGGTLNAADNSSFGTANQNIEVSPYTGEVSTLNISNAYVTAQRIIVAGITANTGTPGTGTVNQVNGTVNASQWVTVGSGGTSGGTGTYNLSGGTLNVQNTAGGTQLEIANFAGSTGTLNISGSAGLNIENNAYISFGANAGAANGTVNQYGGTVTFYSDAGGTPGGTGILYLGKAAGLTNSYVYNLAGGRLQVPTIASASGNSLFYFNGGTLQAAKTNASFMGGLTAAYVSTNGAIIDSSTYAVTIAQALGHDPALGGTVDGGLTSQGSGVITLAGTNTYTGPTAVTAGTLLVNGSIGAGAVTVSGGTLGGGGIINGAVDVQGGGTFSPGAGIGTQSVASSLSFESGSTAQFDFGTGTNSEVLVTGALNLNGSTTVSITYVSAVAALGTYPLIQYGSLSGSLANLTPPTSPNPRLVFSLTNSVATKTISLVVSGVSANLVWHGDGTGNYWDNTGSYQNWFRGTSADYFYDGDYVTFNNIGSNSPSIYLTATVSPSAIIVNSTNNYDIAGYGLIAGPGSLTKSGSGTLTLEDNNTYIGATVINGGTVQVGNAGSTGSLGTGNVTNNGALAFNRTDIITIANAIAGSGTLVQNGSGTVLLTTSNSYTGPTVITAGVLTPRDPSALGTADGGTIATNGGQLFVDQNINLAEPLTLGGAALHKGGGGVTSLAGSVSLVADTTIQVDGGATLNLANSNGISGVGYNLTLNGDSAALGTLAGPLTLGTGGLTKGGAGIWTLSASNNFTGLTTISAGTLRISDATLGSPASFTANQITLGGGSLEAVANAAFTDGNAGITLTANSTLMVDNGVTLTISNNISGANNLTKSSQGTLVLNGSNAFTGTLYVDTANTGGSDGITRIASTNALVNIPVTPGTPTIYQRNNNGGGSTLQLDGTAGNLNIAQDFQMSCRNVTTYNVENVTGSNTLSGTLDIQSGGNGIYLQSDAGTLDIAGNINYIGTLNGGRTYVFSGAGNHIVNGVIAAPVYTNAPINVTMNGTGTLTLANANTYPNVTTVNNGLLLVSGSINSTGGVSVVGGTLGGTGTINDAVTVGTGGTLSPGAGGIGSLVINSNLTLGGTTYIEVSKTGATSDQVTGVVTANYGGTLFATNVAGTLNIGDSFTVFNAAAHTGNFAAITGTPGTGKAWKFNPTNGVLSVVLGVATNPTNITAKVSGNALTLSWPVDHLGWTLQAQTNSSTTGLTTNWVDVAGSAASNTNVMTINPANPTVFYRLRY